MDSVTRQIADELNVRPAQVEAAARLLDGGATVPFVARYRKEATGGLDDAQLRGLESRLAYLRELHERRAAVLESIASQGRLTDELRAAIDATATKQALEDLYLPYRPKRRTQAMIAREAGLEPLADRLWADPGLDPLAEAAGFLAPDAGFADAQAVLDGVRDLLAERWSEDAALLGGLREWLWAEGTLAARLAAGRDAGDAEAAKFRDYHDHAEPIRGVPSHRALAMFRGRALGVLDVALVPPVAPAAADGTPAPGLAEGRIAHHLGWRPAGRPGDALIRRAVAWTWKVRLSLALERDLFARLREAAEATAIRVFADNVRDLLLAAPAGPRVVLGIDPGLRSGCKAAVVDATGRVLATATVYPHEPRRDREGALAALAALCTAHGVDLIAVGNGTASRETDRLAGELIERLAAVPGARLPRRVVVSEAGASVYSASETASRELPALDVTLRGAVSIARRLQDPLAELVKIDPKSIGVGQYQHDVDQAALARSLDAVVEDCVNAVGVDLNTASVPLLARVSGLTPSVAAAIVRRRDAQGAFRSRRELREVASLGPKTFEQSAGFLRIMDGDDPLDRSGVHPETYPLVERMLRDLGRPAAEAMGRADVLRALRPEAYADAAFGIVTVADVLAELEKPGRDPRPDFRVARLDDAVRDIADLRPGMTLEGTVSNVAQFGAFVDLGVHQDGLVHVSQLAHRYVADAREVVRAGAVVRVRVLEVDAARKRIALTMKPDARPEGAPAGAAGTPRAGAGPGGRGAQAGRGSQGGRGAQGDAGGSRPRAGAAGPAAAGDGTGPDGGGRRGTGPAPASAMAAAFERLRRG